MWFALLLLPLPKWNWEHYSIIVKRALFFVASSKTWDIYSPRLQCIATMPLRWALQIAQSNVNGLVQWKCVFFWISDKSAQKMYALHWHPGQENLADYQSKHHTGAHHAAVRPWYLHESYSPCLLPRAQAPSALKGCVGTLDGGYIRKVPLPRAPRLQSTALVTCAVPRDSRDTCHLQVPRIPNGVI